MYTGTMINDLMVTVERIGQRAQEQQIGEDRELHAIFAMQIPFTPSDQVFMGAA